MAAYNACKKPSAKLPLYDLRIKLSMQNRAAAFAPVVYSGGLKIKRCGTVLFYLLRFTSFDRVAFFVDLL